MLFVRRAAILCGVIGASAVVCAGVHAQQPAATAATAKPPSPVVVPADAPGPDKFVGQWDYNAVESVNAATGRPEQAARSATQRRGGVPTGAPASGGGRGGAGGGAPAGGGFSSDPFGSGRGDGGRGLALMMRDNRDLARDLLEVPERLMIAVTSDAVTFTDDLDRERTYPTNGRKQKQQLGAAQFEAKATWNGPQFTKQIEGGFGFKMVEHYFLSSDAKRLFVVIRVGEQRPDDPIVGYNRVYDRIEREQIQ